MKSEGKLWTFVGIGVGIVGSIGLVSGYQLYNSAPDVNSPVAYDSSLPFLVPFTVTNNSFVNFYEVRPTCNISSFDSAHNNSIEGGIFKSGVLWPTLGLKETKDYDCKMNMHGDYHFLSVALTLDFNLRIVPLWPWRKSLRFPFHVIFTSDGTPHWIPGEP
jgi:hypothetical protein